MSESHANDSLRVTLSNLRDLVGDHLQITRYSVAFDVESSFWLDVGEFQEMMGNGAQATSINRLRGAADLYRGDFLAGFHIRDAPDFEEWASMQRMQLRDLAVRALHTLVAYYTQQGSVDHTLAINYSNRLLALEPWQEEIHQLLMLLLAANGQPAAANSQYELCRRILWKELGVEPGAETEEIATRIRRGVLTGEELARDVMAITTRLETLPLRESLPFAHPHTN